MAVIECRDVGVLYRVGLLRSIGLKNYALRKLKHDARPREFWANRHVSFSLERGDMLAVIGINGSGKSTLLKAISGVLKPEEGMIHVEGRLAAIIELYSGFDPEMTVRENTYLRGAMLGLTYEFVNRKYDEIIEYAGLQDFQDYSFQQLSTGMRSQLGFSIACLMKPEILILDEVFSVGDGAFRKKSGERIKTMLKEDAMTGILVSHTTSQLRELCNKILWIDKGTQIIFSDQVELICDAYEEYLATRILPKTEEDYICYSERYRERTQREQKDAAGLNKLLTQMDDNAAAAAAVDILKRYRPELLRE